MSSISHTPLQLIVPTKWAYDPPVTEQKPWERAAETKRRRTRASLIAAADALARRDGVNVRAEDVATEAGVSVATFYNVFPTRGAMFTQTFNEVVSEPHRAAVQSILERTGAPGEKSTSYNEERARLTDLLEALEALLTDRRELVRGALMARISEPPPPSSYNDWLTEGETGADPVRDIACRILYVVPFAEWTAPEGKVDSRRMIAAFTALEQAALLVLDTVANGQRYPLVDTVADVLLGVFEVENTIFDRPKGERRGMNPREREAVAALKQATEDLLNDEA